ncbi:hypothetical protein WR25_26751 [Diploscapter pachys]|uniref:SAM-dependent MTase RsmB/NOP-type domain-containing protein n=1 Tax=Diploscapter pachys TaxID=2018661 RepID=A0A2A2JMH7_9BILA|nr:hypothetical protein WR25_26751 [Diploscapter pachys]
MQQKALEIVKSQKENKLGEEKAAELLGQPERQWDAFYRTQSNKFFKDRQWIIKEFPELDPRHSRNEGKSKITVLEVGCGVGNTAFPILNEIPDDGKFFLFSSDYSQEAVNVLKANDKYDSRRMQAFCWDITEEIPTDPENPSNFPQKGQLDYVICVYILSAIHPEKIKIALKNLTDLLKPGGMILMKDYGRYDLTQLRFIEDNLYCRGDGTLVYFFELDELNGLMEEVGLKKLRAHVDKRLIVNRETKVKMYRRWIQNKKTLLRLTCETLKYRPVFDEILKDQDGLALLSDPAVKHNVNLAYVLLYEYLVGPGLNRASPKLKGAVMKRAKQLKDLERQLAEENRGIDSVKNSEEQDTVQIPRYARINTLKWTNEEALKSLEEEKWTVVRMDSESKFATKAGNLKTDEVLIDPDVENLLVFKTSSNFHEYWMVKEKYLILQDKASCLPAFLLNPPLGSQVFDCCAAPGMKTSHLAAILGNQG